MKERWRWGSNRKRTMKDHHYRCTYSVAFNDRSISVQSVLVDIFARCFAVAVRCCVMLVVGRAREEGGEAKFDSIKDLFTGLFLRKGLWGMQRGGCEHKHHKQAHPTAPSPPCTEESTDPLRNEAKHKESHTHPYSLQTATCRLFPTLNTAFMSPVQHLDVSTT